MNNCHLLILTSLTLVLAGLTRGDPLRVYVTLIENPTHAEEYQCVIEPKIAPTKYSWRKQGRVGLPEGVIADRDRLHFLKSTSDLNGLYICEVDNQFGAAAGSLYRHRELYGHPEF